jgi:hypothetical protein
MTKQECSYCRWVGPEKAYEDNPDVFGLECRSRAPISTGGMMSPSRTVWPIVSHDEWCGDFLTMEGAADGDA